MKPHRDIGHTDYQKSKPATRPPGHLSAREFFRRLHPITLGLHGRSWLKFAKYLQHECQEPFQSPSHIGQGLQPEDRFYLRRQQSLNYSQALNSSLLKSALRCLERRQPPAQHLHMRPASDSLRIRSQRDPEYQSDAACYPSN
ncbi:unannotated protein [freshwater metagenome]|uniref:Unannotated protein n=1 Tax=freshwater metagenome TaxID=449393 RepID=A0A6J6B2U6_9ZZZZ